MDNNEKKYEEVTEVKETTVPEEAKPEMKAPAPEPAAQTAPVIEKAGWGGKHVTRKFLTIALAVALALNVALTAGVTKLLGPGRGFNKGSFGRPGNEQQFDNGRGDRRNMMPPSGNQQPGSQQDQNGQQSQQPGDQQSDSQQSENKDSSDKNNA